MTPPRLSRLALAFLAAWAIPATFGQTAPRPASTFHFGPAQIDCSSYLTATPPAPQAHIASGVGSIQVLQFTPGDIVQLTGGHGLQPGMELRILRMNDKWGEFEQFPGQYRQLKAMGHRVESVGKLRVLSTRGSDALAKVEDACQPIQLGDYGIPWESRTVPPELAAPAFSMAQIPSSLEGAGLVVAARDSAYEAGTHDEIYLNRGTRQGVRPGEFWLIVRGPDSPSQPMLHNVVRGLETPEYVRSHGMAKMTEHAGNLPQVIGQAVVLWAEQSSSTAIVTDAGSTIYPGDQVIPIP